jgi:hypothetical protein
MHDFRKGTAGGAAEIRTTTKTTARKDGEGQASMLDFRKGTAGGAAEIRTTKKTTARKDGEGQASMHDFRKGTAEGAAEIWTTTKTTTRKDGEGQASMHDFRKGTAGGAAEIRTTMKTTACKDGEGQASMHDFYKGTAGGAAEIWTTTKTTARSHASQPQFLPGGATSPRQRQNRRRREDESTSVPPSSLGLKGHHDNNFGHGRFDNNYHHQHSGQPNGQGMGHHQAIGHGGPLLDEYRPGGYELNSGRRSGGGVRNYSPQEEHEQRQAYALPHFQHKHKQQPQQPHRNNQKRPWNRKDVWGTQGGVKFRRINVSNNTSSREMLFNQPLLNITQRRKELVS